MANLILEQMKKAGQSAPVQQPQNGSNLNPNEPLPTSLNDPRMKSVQQYVSNSGMTAKRAFFKLFGEMESKAMNPAAIINKFIGGR